MARSRNDNPDTNMPPNMLCWQTPLRLGKDGKYLAGFTRWTSFAVRKNPTASWISADARVEFMRFENVDDNPEVRDLKISWFAANEKALAVPFPGHPGISACQEPSIVKLPDGRLFCVTRTAAGSPFWSVSADAGESWTQPRRLLRQDAGPPLRHPLSRCPIYDVAGNTVGSGRYLLFIHNQDKVNFFLSGMYNQRKSIGVGESYRRETYTTPNIIFNQTNEPVSDGAFMFLRGGFDYFLDIRNTFTLSANIVRGERDAENLLKINTDSIYQSVIKSDLSTRSVNNSFFFRNNNFALGFKRLFKKSGMELTSDINYSFWSERQRSPFVYTVL